MSEPRPSESLTLPPRGWRITPRHALLAAAACWLSFGLVAGLVLSNRLGAFDSAGLRYFRTGADLHAWASPGMIEAVRDWTALGGVLLRNMIALIALAALLFARLRREAMLLAATIISGWLINTLIKLAVGRPRPELVSHLTDAAGASFPSGHSFNSAVVYMGIALAVASFSPRRPVRWSLIAGAGMVTALIAVSRVWLGVHYPSDALAGWLGGMAWALTASALLYQPTKSLADNTAPQLEAVTPGKLEG